MLLESVLLQHLSKVGAIILCTLSILVWTISATARLQHDSMYITCLRSYNKTRTDLEKKCFFIFHSEYSHLLVQELIFLPQWLPIICTGCFTTSPSFLPHLESPLCHDSCQQRAQPKGLAELVGLDSDLWHTSCLMLEITALNCNLSPVWGHTCSESPPADDLKGSLSKLSQLSVMILISPVPYSV